MNDPYAARTPLVLPLGLCAALSYAAFFPLNLGWLAWVALVPGMVLLEAHGRPRRIYGAAFLGGMAFFVPATQWIRVAHPAMYGSWLFVAVYCSLWVVLGVWAARTLFRTRISPILTLPSIVTAIEYLRTYGPTGFDWLAPLGLQHRIGFGWYLVGYTQHDSRYVIQIADTVGVFGVSFIVVAANTCIYLWLRRVIGFRSGFALPEELPRRPYFATVLTAVWLLAVVAHGYDRLAHPAFREGPMVALIQGNLPQDVKNTRGKEMLEHFRNLSDQAAIGAPELIVWPETSMPIDWSDARSGVQLPADAIKENNYLSRAVLTRWHTPTLLGLSGLTWTAPDDYLRGNAAVLLAADGTFQARYDKMHLVPFGEYVPLGAQLPFLQAFTPYSGKYECTPGETFTRFRLNPTTTFGCIICYEDSDPSLARKYVTSREPVDFLVNISNDGWFNGTEEHEQHLAIARFRAVETRRSLLRSVNMGISAIIDPDGQIVAMPGATWAASKKIEAIVRGRVPLDDRPSLYAQYGDWLPLMSLGAVVLALVLRRRLC